MSVVMVGPAAAQDFVDPVDLGLRSLVRDTFGASALDIDAEITPDGLGVYFAISNLGHRRIYYAVRSDVESLAWTLPVTDHRAGEPGLVFNTNAHEDNPSVSRDGLRLYLRRDFHATGGVYDELWIGRRSTTMGPCGVKSFHENDPCWLGPGQPPSPCAPPACRPVHCAPEVLRIDFPGDAPIVVTNDCRASVDGARVRKTSPAISRFDLHDEKALFFAALDPPDSVGGSGGWDICFSLSDTPHHPFDWTEPICDVGVNTVHDEGDPFVASNGDLYFVSNRSGTGELFRASRLGEFLWGEPMLVTGPDINVSHEDDVSLTDWPEPCLAFRSSRDLMAADGDLRPRALVACAAPQPASSPASASSR